MSAEFGSSMRKTRWPMPPFMFIGLCVVCVIVALCGVAYLVQRAGQKPVAGAMAGPRGGRNLWFAVHCSGTEETVRARVDLEDPAIALVTLADYLRDSACSIATATPQEPWLLASVQPEIRVQGSAVHPGDVQEGRHARPAVRFGRGCILQTEPGSYTLGYVKASGSAPWIHPDSPRVASVTGSAELLASEFVKLRPEACEILGGGSVEASQLAMTVEELTRRMADLRRGGYDPVPLARTRERLWPDDRLRRAEVLDAPILDFILTVVDSDQQRVIPIRPEDPVAGLAEIADVIVAECDVGRPPPDEGPRLVACLQLVASGRQPPRPLRVRFEQGALQLPLSYRGTYADSIVPMFLRVSSSGQWRWYSSDNEEDPDTWEWYPEYMLSYPSLEHAAEYVTDWYAKAFRSTQRGATPGVPPQTEPVNRAVLSHYDHRAVNEDVWLLRHYVRLCRLAQVPGTPYPTVPLSIGR